MRALILAVLLCGCSARADSFDLTVLNDSQVTTAGYCSPHLCARVEKDGHTYLVIINQKEEIIFVYELVGDEKQLLWARDSI